jgi:hypothetical protein
MGWTAVANSDLLALAAEYFDAFITVDRNLAAQQDLHELPIAVIVMRAKTNRLADLKPLVPRISAALPSAQPGVAELVGDA